MCVCVSSVCWSEPGPIKAGPRVLMRYCLVHCSPAAAKTQTCEGWSHASPSSAPSLFFSAASASPKRLHTSFCQVNRITGEQLRPKNHLVTIRQSLFVLVLQWPVVNDLQCELSQFERFWLRLKESGTSWKSSALPGLTLCEKCLASLKNFFLKRTKNLFCLKTHTSLLGNLLCVFLSVWVCPFCQSGERFRERSCPLWVENQCRTAERQLLFVCTASWLEKPERCCCWTVISQLLSPMSPNTCSRRVGGVQKNKRKTVDYPCRRTDPACLLGMPSVWGGLTWFLMPVE